MPIYAYKCASCQHEQDVLQKMSDAPLTVCPSCGKPTFSKQLTAAGFQLKGSGWYATDFKNGPAKPETKPPAKPADTAAAAPAAPAKDAPSGAAAPAAKDSAAPAAPAAGTPPATS